MKYATALKAPATPVTRQIRGVPVALTPERATLKLAALCLHYPEPGFAETVAQVPALLPMLPKEVRPQFRAFCRAVAVLDQLTWAQRYVQSFDFGQETALYLTHQEQGENIKRCAEMVALKRLLAEGGFCCPTDELPDYVPLLLEFLAARPDGVPDGDLPERLARVLAKLAETLEQHDPLYVPILRAAQAVLRRALTLDAPEMALATPGARENEVNP